MRLLEKTESICPICYYEGEIQKIEADIIEDNSKVWIIKLCQKHGSFKEIFCNDAILYKRWMKFKINGNSNPYIKTDILNGSKLYDEQISQTVLTNLVVTSRSNIKNFQNYSNRISEDRVYEPSLDQIRKLMVQAITKKSHVSKAIQITGGEPTLRENLMEIIQTAKKVGFSHVQIRTNGIKLADNTEYCQKIKSEKVNTIYLNFDGISKTTNPLLESNKKTIENCRKVNLNIVLVPHLIHDKNLHEVGKIVQYAIDNIDIIKGVHFETYFFNHIKNRMTNIEREYQCFDYAKILELIEQEYSGMISRDDFYPFSFAFPISKFVEIITHEPQTEFTIHPSCGGSTFIFIENGKPLPITRFIDVEAYMKFLTEQTKKKGPLRKLRIANAFMKNIDTYVNFKKAPDWFSLKQILKDATIAGSDYALREIRCRSLFIGLMAYQNIWNLNIDRLKRCIIHYSTEEGLIPFCSYHAFGYVDKIIKKYGIPISEWEKKTNCYIENDFRNL